ncbi:LEA domain protein [Penicillium digitatum]|uniref:LEA domain protein n=1 Tax=Penicillium digitatum TaxID=36651 RepID=A0A7T7BPT9_PENDI|nr:LEA domain protein [Penicillium digitatum]
MSSPAVSKAPAKLGSKAGTPAKARKTSGSSGTSKLSTTAASPQTTKKTTPRKVSQKAPEPLDHEIEEQSIPETPSPKSKKRTEQRRPISPPDDTVSQTPSASGSVAPLGRAASSLTGKAKGLAGKTEEIVKKGPESVQNGVKNATETAANNLPVPFDLSALEGLEVAEGGNILGKYGSPIGKVVEGDAEDLVGRTVGDDGEIVDEEGDLIGRVDFLHEVADQANNAAEDAQKSVGEIHLEKFVTDIAQLEGLPVSDGGVIKNATGQIVGRIVEGDPEDLIGYTLNEDGEIVDDEGDAIGRVDLISVEEQKKAIEGAADDATDKVSGAYDDLEDQYEDAQNDLSTEKSKIAIESVADEAEEDISDAKADVDKAKSTAKDAAPDAEDATDAVDSAVDDTKDSAKKNNVGLEENVEGATDDAADTDKDAGEDATVTLDDKVEGANDTVKDAKETDADAAADAPKTAEDAAKDVEQRIPGLETLEGKVCNKLGYIINQSTGKPVGQLTEGDTKKISKLGATLDDKGQFWDNRGNVIGKAKALPIYEDEGEEGTFSGLEGLVVSEDGFIEDENSTRVGRLIEGDAKKLSGRGVDEDGEILDRKGNVIGRAERLEPKEEEVGPNFSAVNGLSCNKAGYVIGPEGYPIARVVEGNPKELAGKKIEDGEIYNGKKIVGRVELIPEDELESKPEGPFAGMESLFVTKDGFVQDDEGSIVGKLIEGDAKKLRGRAVDEDGEITDKYGNVKGRAEPYEPPQEEAPAEEDLSVLDGKVINKSGNIVDPATGAVVGRIVEGDKRLAGCKVDGKGQIWGDDGKVVGRAELIPGAEKHKAEGPFYGFDNAVVSRDGVVQDGDKIIGRLIEGDAMRLLGRKVDEDGDVLDKNGNTIGKVERWEPEEKKRDVNPMSGRKITKEGEVRDADGNLIGKLTSGNLATLVGKTVDDNGYVVDNDGNKIGECTLLENIPQPEPEEPEEEAEEGPTAEEQEAAAKAESDRQLAEKMISILSQTLDRVKPVCKQIEEACEKADHTPKEELDEEKLVQTVKPLIEEGGRILQECNGAVRALDPDGRIAATAKARAASRNATPEEYQLADLIKELTETVIKTIDNGKRRIADMPHAKKKLNPLWGLLSEPLFQIIAAVGLLLNGVLGLVGRLLDGLGLGGLLNGLLGSLGLDKLIKGLGLGSLTDALGLGGNQ